MLLYLYRTPTLKMHSHWERTRHRETHCCERVHLLGSVGCYAVLPRSQTWHRIEALIPPVYGSAAVDSSQVCLSPGITFSLGATLLSVMLGPHGAHVQEWPVLGQGGGDWFPCPKAGQLRRPFPAPEPLLFLSRFSCLTP